MKKVEEISSNYEYVVKKANFVKRGFIDSILGKGGNVSYADRFNYFKNHFVW